MKMVVEINDQNFETEVLKSQIPVVVDFWAPWCGPCRALAPITDKLSEVYTGKVKFCKINVDDNPQNAQKYNVMSIPLVLFFKAGAQKDSSLGAVPESVLRKKLEALLAA
jgi:thioredoxin 1